MNLEKRIDDLISKMTLEEKIGQLNQISSAGEVGKLKELIKKGKVGSLIMASTCFAGSDEGGIAGVEYFKELQRIAVEESRLGIPMIFGRNVIHGHHTVYPLPLAMASSFNDELVKTAYRNIASEAALDYIHWTFTPMLDLSRDPRWGRCVESPGEDPYLGSRMAIAMIRGIQGDNLSDESSIAACAKHYIGYGASEGGRDYHHTDISEPSLHNFYLPAFNAAVKAGVQTVMNSFNEIGGQPVASSRRLLTEVLRGELGFNGFVISDWCAIQQLINHGVAADDKQAAELALNAGLDMDMVDECYIKHIADLIKEGRISEETLDNAVRNILRVKLRLGLFEHPFAPKYKIDKKEHSAHARELACESMVLLKNANRALPLKENERVALAGPMATIKETHLGTWTLDGDENDVTSIAEAMKAVGGNRVKCHHAWLADKQMILPWDCDTYVLCLGESRLMSGENNCLADISVPEDQVALAKRAKREGKKVVAVMCFARPVAMQELEPYCDAILYAWHSGTEAGNAVADILYGRVNPSGKIAMTFPRVTGQVPVYYNYLRAARPCNEYYGQGRSYRDIPARPMYPFGYGLSYTDFEIGGIDSDKDTLSLSRLKNGESFKISVKVKNAGDTDGKETVQLYIKDEVSSVVRPLRELKGYKKIFVKAGETVNVEFVIGFEELSFYNAKLEKTVEPGEFTVYVGNDCTTNNAIKTVCIVS